VAVMSTENVVLIPHLSFDFDLISHGFASVSDFRSFRRGIPVLHLLAVKCLAVQ